MDKTTVFNNDLSIGKDCLRYAGINLIAVLFISATIFYGWLFQIDKLIQPLPGHYPMNPVTALSFIFSAISLISLLAMQNFERRLFFRTLLSGVIFVIGLGGLLIYFNVLRSVSNELIPAGLTNFNRFNKNPVVMAPNTALSFVLTGIAIFFMNKRSLLPIYIALLISLISFLALTGYMHAVPEFYGGIRLPMSLPTAVCFLLLSSSILLLERKKGFMAVITSNKSGGSIARLLLPMCLLVPLLIDALRLYGENLGLYEHSFGIALCATLISLIFIYITWKAITFINGINDALTTEISERKKVETEINLANQFMGKILDNIPDMIFIKQGADLRYMKVNKVGEQVMGMKEEVMKGKTDYELFPEKIADYFRTKDLEVYKSGGTVVIEEEPIISEGKERWLRTKKIALMDDSGRPFYMLGISEDITEKRTQEDKIRQFYAELEQKVKERTEELSKSEKRFRALLEYGSDFISMIDSSLRIIYQSPAVERMTGFSIEDRKFEPVLKYAHPDDTEKVASLYESLKEQPNRPFPVQYRMLTRAGSYIWVEGTVTNLLDDEGVSAYVSNYRDITERKKHEDEREQLVTELTQHNKDLRQFSYIISHNLRAPVANLMGLLSIIDVMHIEDPELKNIIKDIESSTNALSSTITDLVAVVNVKNSPSVRIDQLELEEIFVRIIKQISIMVKECGAEIHCDFKKAPRLNFNRSYLESILLNLLTNSLKYRSPERSLEINVHTEERADRLFLFFNDNGQGIETERYKERLFGLYQRFHPGTEGKGLGLYLVKSQMEALNGEIEMESQVGKGTTVILKFKI